jgi:hypothetical protein
MENKLCLQIRLSNQSLFAGAVSTEDVIFFFFLGIIARGGPWPPSQCASILPYSAPFPTIFQPA